MKISIITTYGNEKYTGEERGDAVKEALECYHDIADEVIAIDGSDKYLWKYDWSWEELPKHLNAGLEEASGDWVIKMDIDHFFHEMDLKKIRRVLLSMRNYPVVTFQKMSFVLHNQYYQKGPQPVAINKGMVGDSVKFGQATNAETDLCYPIEVKRLNEYGIPEGSYTPEKFGKAGISFYNYDYSFKTKDQTTDEFWRFSKAYHNYFHRWSFGSTRQDSFNIFVKMMRGRLKRCVYSVTKLEEHPQYIRGVISNLNKDQFAHSGWNLL